MIWRLTWCFKLLSFLHLYLLFSRNLMFLWSASYIFAFLCFIWIYHVDHLMCNLSYILKFKTTKILLTWAECIIVANFVMTSQAVAETWRFMVIKMATVCHLGFLKRGNFNCRYSLEGQCAPSCQLSCWSVNHFRDMPIFGFFSMATVRHIGFKSSKF